MSNKWWQPSMTWTMLTTGAHFWMEIKMCKQYNNVVIFRERNIFDLFLYKSEFEKKKNFPTLRRRIFWNPFDWTAEDKGEFILSLTYHAWLLMSWWHDEPGHQQPLYRPNTTICPYAFVCSPPITLSDMSVFSRALFLKSYINKYIMSTEATKFECVHNGH